MNNLHTMNGNYFKSLVFNNIKIEYIMLGLSNIFG